MQSKVHMAVLGWPSCPCLLSYTFGTHLWHINRLVVVGFWLRVTEAPVRSSLTLIIRLRPKLLREANKINQIIHQEEQAANVELMQLEKCIQKSH